MTRNHLTHNTHASQIIAEFQSISILSVQNGPSYGKAIAASNDFYAYIGSSANRAQIYDIVSNTTRDIFAGDAVITDMVFMPKNSKTLLTASRDKFVSKSC